MKLKYLALTATLVIPAIGHTQNRTAVAVYCQNGNDTIGARVCTSLRDELARSPRYSLANDAEFALQISTVDPLAGIQGSQGKLSAVAGVLTRNGYMVTMTIASCGGNMTAGCAQDILAQFDPSMSK